MTGASIIAAMLRADPAVTAKVPEASIMIARLPDGIALPALLVRTISIVEAQMLSRGETRRRTDRVSVTVRAGSYRDMAAILALVRSCCADRVGTLGGVDDVSVLTAGTGPDVAGAADSYEQAQDFRVSFDEPA